MIRSESFVKFWYRFIVGDDWTVAAAIGLAVLITAALNQKGISAWWLLPLTVVGSTAASLWWREAQKAAG